MDMRGKLALVTGGSDGIGREIALQLQAAGAEVIATGRSADKLQAMAGLGFATIASDLSTAAGIDAVGGRYKLRHRAEFGVSVAREYWGLGIGRALLNACIDCARQAGYTQLELDVVADNARAMALYTQAGFTEYGRNPRGFRSRTAGYQELVYMRLEL